MANRHAAPPPKESPESTPKLLTLGEILYSLAETLGPASRFTLTDRALDAYVLTVAHRTDEDLNRAYRAILRANRFMPSPSELLDACGIPKSFRDGSKPE